MGAVKVNHHVLPRFYLRRFSDPHRQLREHRRGLPAPRMVPLAKATVVRHLYTLDVPGGGESDLLEDLFGRFESAAARVLVEILDKRVWPVHNAARNHLATWIAAQYLRHPRSRESMEADVQRIRNQFATLVRYDDIHEVLGRPDLPRTEVFRMWRSMLDYYPAQGRLPRNLHVKWFAALAADLSRNIFERDWYLVRYDRPRYLLGDDPIIGLLPSNELATVQNFAASSSITMPLDRSTGLLLIDGGRSDGKVRDALAPQGEEHVAVLNRMMVANAGLSVFEHPADSLFPGWAAGHPNRPLSHPPEW